MERFKAKLEPVPHGGQFVVVPPEKAEAAGLKYGARVRGTVNGASFRSSLMKYSGIFHMGVHKATLAPRAPRRAIASRSRSSSTISRCRPTWSPTIWRARSRASEAGRRLARSLARAQARARQARDRSQAGGDARAPHRQDHRRAARREAEEEAEATDEKAGESQPALNQPPSDARARGGDLAVLVRLHAGDADRADDQAALDQRDAALDRQQLGTEREHANAGAARDEHVLEHLGRPAEIHRAPPPCAARSRPRPGST